MKTSNKIILKVVVLAVVILSGSSCKKFLDVGPPKTEAPSRIVFADNITATNAVFDIYGAIMSATGFASGNGAINMGLSADELTNYGLANPYYSVNLLASNDDFWTGAYKLVYKANAVIEGLSNPESKVSDAYKKQLIGEALFVRAFAHFYIVNLFGDAPYVTETDYNVTSLAARAPSAEVYAHIIADLKKAKSMLTDQFPAVNLTAGTERIRPNKGAAGALLARTYLYTKDWKNAVLEADTIINNTTNYTLLADLNTVFLKNSREAIWQLQPSSPLYTNGYEGRQFILTAAPSFFANVAVALSPEIAAAFEGGDKRRTNWVGTFTSGTSSWLYAYKYKQPAYNSSTNVPATTEYSMVLRLAEVYLIRAEARIENENISGGIADLNALRARARETLISLPDLSVNLSKIDALTAVAHERQVELFTEWGHRWLDLKRTGKADAVLGPLKGANWQTEDQLYPIPQSQLINDPAMVDHQNPGY